MSSQLPKAAPTAAMERSGDVSAKRLPTAGAVARDVAEERRRLSASAHPLIQDLLLEPTGWSIWPAVAALRWLLARGTRRSRGIVYRSTPSLTFAGAEITDVAVTSTSVVLSLEAPGLARPASLMPSSDIQRILNDYRQGGALSMWLDAPTDRFMQAAEAARSWYQAGFSLATGGRVAALDNAANLAGRSAPLAADDDGRISSFLRRKPDGAIGLAGLFFGPVSAVGLTDLLRAFTGLPVRVREFAGAEIAILRPARVGGPFGAMLGTSCNLAAAGIEILVEGDGDPDAPPRATPKDA